MKDFKEKWKKAAQAQSELNAKKNKESYDEFKAEMKREKKIMDQCKIEIDELTKKLSKLEEDLNYLEISYQDANDMCMFQIFVHFLFYKSNVYMTNCNEIR